MMRHLFIHLAGENWCIKNLPKKRLCGTWYTPFIPLMDNYLTCTNPVPHSFIPLFFNSFITMVRHWYTLILYALMRYTMCTMYHKGVFSTILEGRNS